jgi:uncharacterized cupin superfamily protein
MIIRKGQTQADQGTEKDTQEYGARESVHLTEEGGLTQFGAHVQTLQPGSRSSDRHWHEKEDELLFMLSGETTVIEEDGPHTLEPGDAACWPAGTANGHQVVNRSEAPCTYLIFGSGAEPDVVHYPDRGDVLYDFEDGTWRIERTDGTVVKEGKKT